VSSTGGEYNARVIEEFRANKGRVGGEWAGTDLLLLHHTGVRTGRLRVNPVGYLESGGRYLVAASNGAAPAHPNWYHNVMARPDVTVEVGARTIEVRASEAAGAERERLFHLMTERFPQLAQYDRKTDRVIPVIVLTPVARRRNTIHAGRELP
jgi:deazaflavin-dependent oxidoreductase (nitroreductase family)